jgi:hypothetical protein
MKKILFSFFTAILLVSGVLRAQNNINLIDAASVGIGGNTTTASSLQSILGNPALFAKDNAKRIVSVGAQNRFQLGELNLFTAGVMIKKKDNAFGVQVKYVGVTDFRQIGFGISYGRRIFAKLDLASRIHFSQLDLGVYGKKAIVDADLGLYSALNKQISFGFWAKNLIHSRFSSVENTETALHLGVAYSPSDKVKLCVESEKYLSQQIRFKAGIEYLAVKNLAFRFGFQSAPAMPTFGLGYISNKIKLDIGAAVHPNLGVTSAFNISFLM